MSNIDEPEKLKRQLERVEARLAEIREKVSELTFSAPTSQKRWKAERKWDYYAQQRMKILEELEHLYK